MSMTTSAEPVREAKKAPPYSVRRLGPNDEAKIIELCSIVFGNTMPSEHWRWQFPENPFSRPIVYLAETPDGRLVGHYSLIPRPFRDGSRRTLAALSIQSMVHPDFQKQGILKALAAAAEKQLDEDGVEIGITFLNDNSLHAYTQHFGWTELAGPNFILFTVLECGPAIQKILKVEAIARVLAPVANPVARLVFRAQKPREASGRTIRPVERFDERTDALWERFARSIGRGTERSARYLNWRLADKPDHYRMFVAEDDADGGRVSGLVVTKTERKFGLYFGYVAELMFDPDDEETGLALASHALDSLRAEGCSMASAVTAGSASVLRVLRRAGFWRLPRKAMPHGIHFCYKRRANAPDASSRSRETDGEWFLSWIDHDVV
jgi:GNAT superfamily N-acetyltransferase